MNNNKSYFLLFIFSIAVVHAYENLYLEDEKKKKSGLSSNSKLPVLKRSKKELKRKKAFDQKARGSPSGMSFYTVEKGENFAQIVRSFHKSCSMPYVELLGLFKEANSEVKNFNRIRVGLKLQVPSVCFPGEEGDVGLSSVAVLKETAEGFEEEEFGKGGEKEREVFDQEARGSPSGMSFYTVEKGENFAQIVRSFHKSCSMPYVELLGLFKEANSEVKNFNRIRVGLKLQVPSVCFPGEEGDVGLSSVAVLEETAEGFEEEEFGKGGEKEREVFDQEARGSPSGMSFYTVEKGENFAQIVRSFHKSCSMPYVELLGLFKEANSEVKNFNRIRVGLKLQVPSVCFPGEEGDVGLSSVAVLEETAEGFEEEEFVKGGEKEREVFDQEARGSPSGMSFYTVEKGENFAQIVRSFHKSCSMPYVELLGLFKEANSEVKNFNRIRVGLKLQVPSVCFPGEEGDVGLSSVAVLEETAEGFEEEEFVKGGEKEREVFDQEARGSPSGMSFYTVEKGDSFSQIVSSFRKDCSTTYIKRLNLFKESNNEIKNFNKIRINQKIKIPSICTPYKENQSELFSTASLDKDEFVEAEEVQDVVVYKNRYTVRKKEFFSQIIESLYEICPIPHVERLRLFEKQNRQIKNFNKIKPGNQIQLPSVCLLNQKTRREPSSIAFKEIAPRKIQNKLIQNESISSTYFRFSLFNSQRILRGENVSNDVTLKLISKPSNSFSMIFGFETKSSIYETEIKRTLWKWYSPTSGSLSKNQAEQGSYSFSYLRNFWLKNKIFTKLDFQEEVFYIGDGNTITFKSAFNVVPKVGLQFNLDLSDKSSIESSHLIGRGIYGRTSSGSIKKSNFFENKINLNRKFKWGSVGTSLNFDTGEVHFSPYENQYSDFGISFDIKIDF